MRTVVCHCGASAPSVVGTVKQAMGATGFLAVMDNAGTIRWYCPEHTTPLIAAARAMMAVAGPNSSAMLPGWLVSAAQP